jgi:outer membrane protein assembly factor BamD
MLRKQIQKLALIALVAFFFTSCNEYQKVLKNNDTKEMYEYAMRYYEEEDYPRAKHLFELIAPKYVGKPQGERLSFFFADAQFKTRSYYLSSYQFERFIKSYPASDKREQATFYEAKSYYLMSPKFSLDQSDTDKALSKLQLFINAYPNSEFFDEASEMAIELGIKKERKAFEIGKQFDRLGEFNFPVLKASMKSMDNFISENPGSIYREEAHYIRLKSATQLAMNSTFDKMKERFEQAKEYFDVFKKNYPQSKFEEESTMLLSIIDAGLQGEVDFSRITSTETTEPTTDK